MSGIRSWGVSGALRTGDARGLGLALVLAAVFGLGAFSSGVQADADDQYGPWSAPVNLGAAVNTATNDQHPAISQDGLSLYLVSDRPGGFGGLDIWVSHRACIDADDPACAWQTPANLGPNINSAGTDMAPTFTPDGHRMYFHSNGRGGCGLADLFVTQRHDNGNDFGWEAPENLGCVVNGPYFDAGPTYFEDEATGVTTLYFTVRNNPPTSDQGFDIYASTRTGDEGAFGSPVLVPELSSPYRDTRTAIRRDGLEMFLSSGRPGDDVVGRSAGNEDLWVSMRATTGDAWSPPLNLNLVNQQLGGPPVNGAAFDGAPALSFDGTTLYFFSERPGGLGARDLYVTTRARLGSFGDVWADAGDAYNDWSAPANLGPPVNTGALEQTPGVSKDGLSLYFACACLDSLGSTDIYVSQRASVDDPWGPPQNLGSPVNTPFDDQAPTPTIDGHRLYLRSNRPGGFGNNDLYVSHRQDQQDPFGWGMPKNLGAVNSPYDDSKPALFEDDLTGTTTLYFQSNRPGGMGARDIYASTLQPDETFGPGVLVVELSSPFEDQASSIRRDGLEFFLSSNRPGTLGGLDILVSTRATTSDPWSVPVNLGPIVNTAFTDAGNWISFDGKTLYIHSNRPGGMGDLDIWSTTREGL